MAGERRRRWLGPTLAVAALIALLVFVANAAFWVDRHVADEEAFTTTVATVLVTDEARLAMAERIVEEIVAEVPALLLIRNPLTDVVASILASPLMTDAVHDLAAEIHRQVTSDEPSAVVVTLVEVKDALLNLLDEFAPGVSELIPDRIFTAIEVVGAGVLPSYATAVGAAPWLWPLTLVLALVLAALLIVLMPVRAAGVLAVGLAVSAAGLVGLASSALARSPLLDEVSDPLLRTVGELAYASFARSYIAQTLWLLVAGVFLAGAGAVWLAFVRPAVQV